ncbi:uncharacterized protein LOC141637622 [Silene latifolia]|uniref:uncharacterized protein LOC141637622 n=1 Tax=Silene latifolia TaxID=37657 RepID=UPI003D78ADAA
MGLARGADVGVVQGVGDRVWKFIWGLNVPPKLIHFIWRACSGVLAVKSNLFRRHCCPDDICPSCGVDSETVLHALYLCPSIRQYWEASGFEELLSNTATTSVSSWVIEAIELLHGDEKGRFLAMLWAMWAIRNDKIFEEEQRCPDVTILGLVRMVAEYQGYKNACVGGGGRVLAADVGSGAWSVPNVGETKINCDAAMFDGGEVGLGAVGRNALGEIVFVASRRCRAGWSVDVAEAKALEFGLEIAKRLEMEVVVLESDALNVVKAVSKRAFSRNSLGMCVSDICRYFSLLAVKNICHVKRGGNTVAHLTARICHIAGEERIYVTDFPTPVTSLAELDLI